MCCKGCRGGGGAVVVVVPWSWWCRGGGGAVVEVVPWSWSSVEAVEGRGWRRAGERARQPRHARAGGEQARRRAVSVPACLPACLPAVRPSVNPRIRGQATSHDASGRGAAGRGVVSVEASAAAWRGVQARHPPPPVTPHRPTATAEICRGRPKNSPSHGTHFVKRQTAR